MYTSVLEFFEAEHKELILFLGNGGDFWPRLRNNTVTTAELVAVVKHHEDPYIKSLMGIPENYNIYNASKAVIEAREKGTLPTPPTQTTE